MDYIEVLEKEVEVLNSMLRPCDTGHIRTAINVLKERIEELKNPKQKKLVMVEVLSQHCLKYVIEVEDNIDHAVDEYIIRECDPHFKEFSQKHLEPTVLIDHHEITKEEYLEMFDKDNDYLKSWSEEQKLTFINKINY
jgi:hypothetical protein